MDSYILLVDDDERLLSSLSQLLQRNYNVITAMTSDEALDKLNQYQVSVCLLDQNLDESITGLEFAHILKNNFPYLQIIMLTGESNPDLVISAINSEVINAFLVKPYKYTELKEYIDDYLMIWEKQKNTVNQVVKQIETGKVLNQDQINKLKNHLTYFEDLLFDTVYLKEQSEHISLMGFVLYRDEEVFYKKFLNSEFNVKNESLFVGLIESLSKISGELFTSSKKGEIEEITMKNITMLVKTTSSFKAVMFVHGTTNNPTFKLEMSNLIDRIRKIIPEDSKELQEHEKNILDTEMVAFNTFLKKNS